MSQASPALPRPGMKPWTGPTVLPFRATPETEPLETPAETTDLVLDRDLEPPGGWGRAESEHPCTRSFAKRTFDVVAAAVLLVLVSPLLLLAMLAVAVTSPGAPVLFRQTRIGLRCRPFFMLKLRTMVPGAERLQDRLAAAQGDRTFLKLAHDPRVTRLGRFLRKYSIDELPQLWNVIRGDMSLVGPRPLLVCDLRKFPRGTELRRFVVRPGVTGLWQVSGRSSCTDAQRIALDLHYVDTWSVGADLRILARTVPVVLTAEGAV